MGWLPLHQRSNSIHRAFRSLKKLRLELLEVCVL